MSTIAAALPTAPLAAAQRSPGYWQSVLGRLLTDKLAMAAGLVVLGLLVLAVFGPWLAPADPYQASMMKRLAPIGSEGYPLGSDELGRDMLRQR